MIEVEMGTQEILKEHEKKNEAIAAQTNKAMNFSIPIKTNSNNLGTKPLLKDSLINSINFESTGVLILLKDARGGYDDTYKWSLSLSLSEFILGVPGLKNHYNVISAQYNKENECQEFQLTRKEPQDFQL